MSSSLSLREKLGQLLMVGFRGAEPAECSLIERDLRDHAVGGIVLFDQEMVDATARRRNVVSPDQVERLVAHLQASARQPGTLLVSIDQEGGRVNRLKADYGFPPSVSQDELGQLDQLDETTRQARLTARTLARVGINFNLAPVVDLDANPNNPIIKGKRRCFSADPELTARHASAVVQAHRDEGVLTCLKHFPGHGSAAGDTHLGLVDVTQTWSEKELIPFQRLIDAGLCDAVMSAHVFNARLDPDRPATLSRAVITGLLRQKLGFQGRRDQRRHGNARDLQPVRTGGIRAGRDRGRHRCALLRQQPELRSRHRPEGDRHPRPRRHLRPDPGIPDR